MRRLCTLQLYPNSHRDRKEMAHHIFKIDEERKPTHPNLHKIYIMTLPQPPPPKIFLLKCFLMKKRNRENGWEGKKSTKMVFCIPIYLGGGGWILFTLFYNKAIHFLELYILMSGAVV